MEVNKIIEMEDYKTKINKIIMEFLTESFESSPVLYHGSDNEFEIFNDNKPIFFVDDPNIAKTYGNHIIKARLKMENPIELDFDGNSTYYFFNKWYLPSELANEIKKISDDLKNQYTIDDDLKEYLEELGFSELYGDLDGIIMKNIRDAKDGVFSTHKPANNFVVFDKQQIHQIGSK